MTSFDPDTLAQDKDITRGIYRRFEGKLALDWGLSGVPETYLVDATGTVRLHYRRAINERDVTETILPLLKGAK